MDNMPGPMVLVPPPEPVGLIFGLSLLVGGLLSLATARAWIDGEWTGKTLGYALASTLSPDLIAYAFAGRNEVREYTYLGCGFVD